METREIILKLFKVIGSMGLIFAGAFLSKWPDISGFILIGTGILYSVVHIVDLHDNL